LRRARKRRHTDASDESALGTEQRARRALTIQVRLLYRHKLAYLGHDGPGHLRISEGNTKVRPLHVYHGKVGRGLSVEMSVKHGPITVLSVVQTGDRKLELLVAEGESVPGPTLEIGNTNSRYRFPLGARAYVNAWSGHGPAHHCAVGVGHVAAKIEKLGSLLDMEVSKVC